MVALEWDFDGGGTYPVTEAGLDGARSRLIVKTAHIFTEPGTYFPALRVTGQREGDTTTPFARVQNLGQLRVVVA